MANNYYDPTTKVVVDGNIVHAADINTINSAVGTAFDIIESDLDDLSSGLLGQEIDAKNWATADRGVRPDVLLDLYSSKAYALEAKDWAEAPGLITAASTGATIAGSSSAKTQAAASAASANTAASQANTATTQAGIATTQAGIATTKASEAAASAVAAAASALDAANAALDPATIGANNLVAVNGTATSLVGKGISTLAYTSNPAANGTASPGVATTFARGDHVHPASSTTVSGAVPIGTIVAYIGGYFASSGNWSFTSVTGNTVAAVNNALNSSGWFVCNGVTCNQSANGATIYNTSERYLPDLTDSRFIQGYTSVGTTGGSNSGSASVSNHSHYISTGTLTSSSTTLSTSQIPSHHHGASGQTMFIGDGVPGNAGITIGSDGYYRRPVVSTGGGGSHSHTTSYSGYTSSTGSDSISWDNRPTFLNALYIIRVF